MVVFQIQHTDVNPPRLNDNDEIIRYQIGRYISSNEAVWHIFGFPIHERDPAVIHLATRLENGVRVSFTNETAIEHAMSPPITTLAEFSELCNHADTFGAFARILLHSEVPRYFTWNQTKNGCPASKAYQLMHAPAYSNQTFWTEYIQSIQERLSASGCYCCCLKSPAYFHFKIYAE